MGGCCCCFPSKPPRENPMHPTAEPLIQRKPNHTPPYHQRPPVITHAHKVELSLFFCSLDLLDASSVRPWLPVTSDRRALAGHILAGYERCRAPEDRLRAFQNECVQVCSEAQRIMCLCSIWICAELNLFFCGGNWSLAARIRSFLNRLRRISSPRYVPSG